MTTTITAKTSVTACTTAKSRLKIESSIRVPMPGNANTRSTTRVLPTRYATLTPSTVTDDTAALRSVWLRMTLRCVNPFARAVTT